MEALREEEMTVQALQDRFAADRLPEVTTETSRP
jgi:hypothetical protein